MSNTGMVVITDLITMKEVYELVVRNLGGIDVSRTLSAGPDGLQEMAKLFENDVKQDQLVCTFQIAETPISDNGAGLTCATFACTVMIMKKMGAQAALPDIKLAARNETWKKMLRFVGLIRQASEWYASEVTEIEGQDYQVIFDIFQDKILPVGKIANANLQGWLIDIDVTIPVNGLMYV